MNFININKSNDLHVKERDSYLEITNLKDFLISQIFDCGQCFRFNSVIPNEFEGVAFGKYIRIVQSEPHTIYIYNTNLNEFNSLWKHYLSLDTDYTAIKSNILSHFENDPTIKTAMSYSSGIRILRQEPWETICSFIISQNNNIPRIKGIINNLSRAYGEPIYYQDKIFYSFPTVEAIYRAGISAIFELKTGFRAKYIYDAAERIVKNQLNLDYILNNAETAEGTELLQQVKGIGPKVAACSLLFGFEKTDAFPIDVWMKRVIQKYYPDGLNISSLGEYAGIAQQYLFYYERYINN